MLQIVNVRVRLTVVTSLDSQSAYHLTALERPFFDFSYFPNVDFQSSSSSKSKVGLQFNSSKRHQPLKLEIYTHRLLSSNCADSTNQASPMSSMAQVLTALQPSLSSSRLAELPTNFSETEMIDYLMVLYPPSSLCSSIILCLSYFVFLI